MFTSPFYFLIFPCINVDWWRYEREHSNSRSSKWKKQKQKQKQKQNKTKQKKKQKQGKPNKQIFAYLLYYNN